MAVKFNNKFSLDGRDENGYMGIAWCFGNHDRPFPDRPFFGEVRPMTRNGLESKFNVQRYKQLVQRKCRNALAKEPRLMALLPQCAFGGTESTPSLLKFCISSQDAGKNAHKEKTSDFCAVQEPASGSTKACSESTNLESEESRSEKALSTPDKEKAVGVRGGAKRKSSSALPQNQNGLHKFFKSSPSMLDGTAEVAVTKRCHTMLHANQIQID